MSVKEVDDEPGQKRTCKQTQEERLDISSTYHYEIKGNKDKYYNDKTVTFLSK